jgi:hypothetical protein
VLTIELVYLLVRRAVGRMLDLELLRVRSRLRLRKERTRDWSGCAAAGAGPATTANLWTASAWVYVLAW